MVLATGSTLIFSILTFFSALAYWCYVELTIKALEGNDEVVVEADLIPKRYAEWFKTLVTGSENRRSLQRGYREAQKVNEQRFLPNLWIDMSTMLHNSQTGHSAL